MRRFNARFLAIMILIPLCGCAGFNKLGRAFSGKPKNCVEDKNFQGDPHFGMEASPIKLQIKNAEEIAKTPGVTFLEMHYGPTSAETVGASGMIIPYDNRPHILSAGHINDGPSTYVGLFAYFSEGRKKPEEVELVAFDKHTDLALLRFKDPNFKYDGPYPPLGASADLRAGQKVFALGYPYGFTLAVSEGVISTLGVGPNYDTIIQPQWLLHWATLNPGNSGGPLFDGYGRLIGINNKGFSGGGGTTTMQVATPIDDVKLWLRSLKKTGEFQPPLAGIQKIHHTRDLNDLNFKEKEIKRPERNGWMIYELVEDGQAERAGLKVGDIVLEFDGRTPKSYMDISRYIMFGRVAGDEIQFKVDRFGEEKIVKVKLESHEDYEKREKEKYREKLRRNR